MKMLFDTNCHCVDCHVTEELPDGGRRFIPAFAVPSDGESADPPEVRTLIACGMTPERAREFWVWSRGTS